jgi:hypothetical protein
MSGTCSMHGGNEKGIQNLQSENSMGRDHFEDLGVGDRIIVNRTLKIQSVRMLSIHLYDDRV